MEEVGEVLRGGIHVQRVALGLRREKGETWKRPAGTFHLPMWQTPWRKVPVQRTTAEHAMCWPLRVTTPLMVLLEESISNS